MRSASCRYLTPRTLTCDQRHNRGVPRPQRYDAPSNATLRLLATTTYTPSHHPPLCGLDRKRRERGRRAPRNARQQDQRCRRWQRRNGAPPPHLNHTRRAPQGTPHPPRKMCSVFQCYRGRDGMGTARPPLKTEWTPLLRAPATTRP
eukprot:2340545-Pyramimonas_sp.AAC.1